MARADRGEEIIASMHLESISYGNTTEEEMIVEDYPYTVHTKEDMQYERIAAAFCIMFIATILATYLTIELSNCIKKSSLVRRWQSQSYPNDDNIIVHVHRSEFGFPPPYRPDHQQAATEDTNDSSDMRDSTVQLDSNDATTPTGSTIDLSLPARDRKSVV